MSILIDADTTFIVQGITGREAVNLTRECLDYGKGAQVVGGVTPGRKGRDVHGVPVFDTVDQAVAHHGRPIDGSVVTVPPAFTKDAVFEAIENGVKLVVIVTERIPRRDVAEMVELAALRGARIIGPNCLGIIVPDVIKMGGIGGPARNARFRAAALRLSIPCLTTLSAATAAVEGIRSRQEEATGVAPLQEYHRG